MTTIFSIAYIWKTPIKMAIDIDKAKNESLLRVVSRFSGTLKNNFLNDVKKGYKGSDLIRQMAIEYYERKSDKNSY